METELYWLNQPLRDWIATAFSVSTMIFMAYVVLAKVLPIQVKELRGSNGLRRVKIHMIVMVVALLLFFAGGTGMCVGFVLDLFLRKENTPVFWWSSVAMNVLVFIIAMLLHLVYVKDRYDKHNSTNEVTHEEGG